ncbi:MAG: hypothetical protein ACREJN_17130 [Nitrospiraceae bacterium]
MITSHFYRHNLGLLAGLTLLLICFLSTGCTLTQSKQLSGPDLQLPAVVLSVESHDFLFDMDKTTIGGRPVSEFIPKAKFWRLNVFLFSDGTRIGGNDAEFYLLKDKRSETLYNLPWDTLLRADLDFTNNPQGDDTATTVSGFFLLHKE